MGGFDINSYPGGLPYGKLSQVLADAGYILQASEQNGAGPFTGVSLRRSPLVSGQRRLAVGMATKKFDYQWSGTAQNTALWKCLTATMTATQSAQGLLLNANSTLTTTTGVSLSSWRYFNLPGNGTIQVEFGLSMNVTPLTNQQWNVGMFPPVSATATPTDGVYFKFTNAGLVGIINFNGTETPTGVLLTANQLTYPQVYNYRADINNLTVEFFVNDSLMASLPVVAANGLPANWCALPVTIQQWNPGAVSGSPVMQLRAVTCSVTQRDLATNKSWETQQTGAGLTATQGSEGNTIGSTANLANNAAFGGGAALSNTAALITGLGGQASILPTLAAGTDGIVCSYTNPLGSINIIPRTIYVRGVWINGCVTTVLAGGPVSYLYSLAYGHTAVSLATADSASFANATTKSARRVPLGAQSWAATAAVGTIAQQLYHQFAAPIPVNPGESIAVVAKNAGVVTTAGVISMYVGFDAFFE